MGMEIEIICFVATSGVLNVTYRDSTKCCVVKLKKDEKGKMKGQKNAMQSVKKLRLKRYIICCTFSLIV